MEMSNQKLKGLRVQLLPFSSKYWETIAKWAYNNDYKDFFRQFPRALTEEDLMNYDKVVGGEVFIVHSLKDNSAVGMVQVIPCYKKNKGGFIGIIVDNSAQKSKIQAEINYLIMDHLFNTQGYNKIIIKILESRSDLKKHLDQTGFYREGKLLQECFLDGKFQNELRYSMSAYYFNKNKDKWLKEFKLWVDSSRK